MKSKHWCVLSLAVLILFVGALVPASVSHGQGEYKPSSNVGGYARSELGNIYRSDVGQGYTGEGLNNIALANARAQVGYVGQMNTRPGAGAPSRIGFGTGTLGGGKPFSSYSPSPTTSPYLNLFREDFEGGGDFNYQTLVRPMVQQQQFNQQAQRQNMEISRRLQTMAAQNDYGQPQGDKNQYPTGHQTVFKYYGHFHPRSPYRPGKVAP